MLARRLPPLIIGLVALSVLALSVTFPMNANRGNRGFWSDEATYHSMAYSFAMDGDMQYERRDLERVYEQGYPGGPSGLFLIRDPDGGGLYFAKAFLYSLVAAPFVRLLGDNGFLLLHAALLALCLGAGYLYLRRAMAPGSAALYSTTFLLASVATLYLFWITPEWFNLSLMFLATFLWLYKERPPGAPEPAAPPQVGLLGGAWTDYAAALVYGLAIYSKPPNVLMLAPLLAWQLLRGRWRRGVALGLVATLTVVALFGCTAAAIGQWNYQGGDRKTFTAFTSYPFVGDAGFDDVGIRMQTDVSDLTSRVPPATSLLRDAVYVWLGRNGGILPYMFPAVVALIAFAAAPRRRLRSPHGLLAGGFLLEIAALAVVIHGNWIGGGGTVGSRYFVNVYPVAFFLIPAGIGVAGAVLSWAVWGAFLAQIVLNPFASSFDPARHTARAPWTLLPVEMTLLHNLPFNVRASARLVELDRPATFLAYFLDAGTWGREGDLGGFWIQGGKTGEVVLRSRRPLDRLALELHNRTRDNRVVVWFGGQRVERQLRPDERIELTLDAPAGHRYEGTWLYRLAVLSETGAVPRFDTPDSDDTRYLGVFVRPRVEPAIPFRSDSIPE